MKSAINYEEKIGKTVGRRSAPKDMLAFGMALQKNGAALAKGLRRRGLPKGVFRFHSHEEADAWLMKHLIQNAQS